MADNPLRCQLDEENYFPFSSFRLTVGSRETDTTVPSRVSLLLPTHAKYRAYVRAPSLYAHRQSSLNTPEGPPAQGYNYSSSQRSSRNGFQLSPPLRLAQRASVVDVGYPG